MIERYPERDILGLPAHGRYVVVTNSELSRLPCPRRFWFGEIEHLKSKATHKMDLGTAWDHLIECVWRYVRRHDRPYPLDIPCPDCTGRTCQACKGHGSPLDAVTQMFDPETQEEARDQLARAFEGWILTHNGGFFRDYEVVGSQLALARPILDPRTGQPMTREIYLEEHHDRLYPAWSGAILRNPFTADWPVYYLGRLDLLIRHRVTRVGWVVDSKYSGQPDSYERKMLYDPQLPGYGWLVDAHLEALGLTRIAGYMYDVTSSAYHYDPKVLTWKPPTIASMKAQCKELGIPTTGLVTSDDYQRVLQIVPAHPGFSQAQNQTTPSWRYKRAVLDAGLNLEDYAEHIEYLTNKVDPGLYKRPRMSLSPEVLMRFGREVYARADLVMSLRQQAAQAITPLDIDLAFPRVPICQSPGGYCPFSQPCVQDSQDARATFQQLPSQSWPEDME